MSGSPNEGRCKNGYITLTIPFPRCPYANPEPKYKPMKDDQRFSCKQNCAEDFQSSKACAKGNLALFWEHQKKGVDKPKPYRFTIISNSPELAAHSSQLHLPGAWGPLVLATSGGECSEPPPSLPAPASLAGIPCTFCAAWSELLATGSPLYSSAWSQAFTGMHPFAHTTRIVGNTNHSSWMNGWWCLLARSSELH